MVLKYWPVIIILTTGVLASVKTGKLTVAGALTGGILGWFIFSGAGYTGLAMMAVFFLLGTAATAWKISKKEGLGLAEKNKGQRKMSQVVANAGVGGLLGFMAWHYPEKAAVFRLMMAAGFASATADTLSSELGNVYGSRFYNILNFQTGSRGRNGVISAEGSILGLIGSVLIALIYACGFGWNVYIAWIILAATTGNISDSLLGATLEHNGYLNNDAVNFFNTLIAAFTALVLCSIFH